MKTLSIVLFAAALAVNTFGLSLIAVWTGKSRYGTSVTGRQIVSCEYRYNNQLFWKTFDKPACPSTIEVY